MWHLGLFKKLPSLTNLASKSINRVKQWNHSCTYIHTLSSRVDGSHPIKYYIPISCWRNFCRPLLQWRNCFASSIWKAFLLRVIQTKNHCRQCKFTALRSEYVSGKGWYGERSKTLCLIRKQGENSPAPNFPWQLKCLMFPYGGTPSINLCGRSGGRNIITVTSSSSSSSSLCGNHLGSPFSLLLIIKVI